MVARKRVKAALTRKSESAVTDCIIYCTHPTCANRSCRNDIFGGLHTTRVELDVCDWEGGEEAMWLVREDSKDNLAMCKPTSNMDRRLWAATGAGMICVDALSLLLGSARYGSEMDMVGGDVV